jgi:hypothetical protein
MVTRFNPNMPLSSARSSAGTVIPTRNEYWPALTVRSSCMTRASTRKPTWLRIRPTRCSSVEMLCSDSPRSITTVRRSRAGCQPAGRNRS